MIMRKNEKRSKKSHPILTKQTTCLFVLGMICIWITVFFAAFYITQEPPIPHTRVRYYAKMLEHILAALALLLAECYLVQRITQKK